MDEHDVKSFAQGVDHCEGIAYGTDGRLYAVGYAGQVYHISLETGKYEIIGYGNRVLGLALDADNNIYGCDCIDNSVVKIKKSGKRILYSRGAHERHFLLPNFPVFDSSGNLYISDSGNWEGEPNGCIFKIQPGGETNIWHRGPFRYPNGLALNGEESELYVIESNWPGVIRIPIKSNGSAGEVKPVVEMPMTVPDGLAFDEEGNFWIATHRPDAIYRYITSDDRLELFVKDWRGEYLRGPTNLTFAGPDLDVLVIASLDNACLYRIDTGIKGQRLNYPSI